MVYLGMLIVGIVVGMFVRDYVLTYRQQNENNSKFQKFLSDLQSICEPRDASYGNQEKLDRAIRGILLPYFMAMPDLSFDVRIDGVPKTINRDTLPEVLFQIKNFCIVQKNKLHEEYVREQNSALQRAISMLEFKEWDEHTIPDLRLAVNNGAELHSTIIRFVGVDGDMPTTEVSAREIFWRIVKSLVAKIAIDTFNVISETRIAHAADIENIDSVMDRLFSIQKNLLTHLNIAYTDLIDEDLFINFLGSLYLSAFSGLDIVSRLESIPSKFVIVPNEKADVPIGPLSGSTEIPESPGV